MGEPRQCCFLTYGNHRCKVTNNLNRILVLDPEKSVQEKWGCYEHIKVFYRSQTDDIEQKLFELDLLKQEIEKSKKLDILHRIQQEQSGSRLSEFRTSDKRRLDAKKSLDDEIKKLRNFTCRSIYCRKPIEANEFKCAIELRTHYNTPRNNLYYHRNCIHNIKGMLGFVLPLHKKQFRIEDVCKPDEMELTSLINN